MRCHCDSDARYNSIPIHLALSGYKARIVLAPVCDAAAHQGPDLLCSERLSMAFTRETAGAWQ